MIQKKSTAIEARIRSTLTGQWRRYCFMDGFMEQWDTKPLLLFWAAGALMDGGTPGKRVCLFKRADERRRKSRSIFISTERFIREVFLWRRHLQMKMENLFLQEPRRKPGLWQRRVICLRIFRDVLYAAVLMTAICIFWDMETACALPGWLPIQRVLLRCFSA